MDLNGFETSVTTVLTSRHGVTYEKTCIYSRVSVITSISTRISFTFGIQITKYLGIITHWLASMSLYVISINATTSPYQNLHCTFIPTTSSRAWIKVFTGTDHLLCSRVPLITISATIMWLQKCPVYICICIRICTYEYGPTWFPLFSIPAVCGPVLTAASAVYLAGVSFVYPSHMHTWMPTKFRTWL
jgi:hypothetical protein